MAHAPQYVMVGMDPTVLPKIRGWLARQGMGLFKVPPAHDDECPIYGVMMLRPDEGEQGEGDGKPRRGTGRRRSSRST